MGGALNAGDTIDGGSGSDAIVLTGMGDTDTLTLGPTTLTSVENMTLKLGHDYDIVMDDGNVADGGNLKIDASSLRSTDSQGGGDVVIDVTGFTGTLTTANFT
jgi:hypothetical protein